MSIKLNNKSMKENSLNNNSLKYNKADIYTGQEEIKFYNRHAIYKALMKLEFEDAIRELLKKSNDIK